MKTYLLQGRIPEQTIDPLGHLIHQCIQRPIQRICSLFNPSKQIPIQIALHALNSTIHTLSPLSTDCIQLVHHKPRKPSHLPGQLRRLPLHLLQHDILTQHARQPRNSQRQHKQRRRSRHIRDGPPYQHLPPPTLHLPRELQPKLGRMRVRGNHDDIDGIEVARRVGESVGAVACEAPAPDLAVGHGDHGEEREGEEGAD